MTPTRVWTFLLPKLNLWILAVVVAVFVVIDQLAIPPILAHEVVPNADYRTKVDYTDIKAFIEEVNRDRSPKIILVGDSITQGGGVANGDETISHYLQQNVSRAGYAYHVYNFGIEGAEPGDCYAIVKSLRLTSKDLVVYDMNVGDYGVSPVRFREITPMLVPMPVHTKSTALVDPVEDWLRRFVNNHWKLFAYRGIVKTYLANWGGGPPITASSTKHAPDPPPWYTKDWTAQTKGMWKRGSNVFHDNDGALTFNRLMIQDVRSHGAKILVYNIPLNQKMMAQYQMIDEPKYKQNIARLKAAMLGAGAIYRDYEYLIPSDDFIDSLHPTRAGNEILANQLMKDLTPYFATGSLS
ncbi:hypothetical protein GCM10025857_25440 [Alicyclobacillus contaminans]|uniref:SGNH/GDSL hydrolase family protein n=1 Tax=Alicyclobacillus contaminans TaxID=392016 RepID=UPI00040EC133|nr:SGNH/GDSL hydrolase family protein [Alicyclobacillus contaminans]GMA51187.1 hypothetical protein GCM10025857_25440 [Alicyclobacillus contaminans]